MQIRRNRNGVQWRYMHAINETYIPGSSWWLESSWKFEYLTMHERDTQEGRMAG